MTIALEFARASKQFTLQHERPESLQDRFVQIFRRRQTATTFWALRDVSFQVTDGETFGILGRNGAGKSTLLKLATGILQPSSGRVAQHRRTYAMLELGAGFHPELTGRDNVLLNGSIHGLSRADTRAIFDQIVDFAELEPFIDTPVKHYSSGMFMRLVFATAIHMKPELLVIDEILAVGDAAFRRKCTDALWALKRQGVTILFVSHNEEAVYQFCDRALLLVDGQVAALGPVQQVVGHYTRLLEEREAAGDRGRSHLAIQAAAVLDAAGRETLVLAPDQPWAIDIAVATPPGRATIEGTVALETETGGPVIVAPLRLDVPDDGAHLRQLRATFATLPLHNGRLRLHVRLTARSDGQLPVMDEYLSPQSITVGEASYGPLLKVAPVWTDRTAASQSSPVRREVEAETAALDLDQAIFARYFAEGITGPDGATRLDITNPSALPAQIVLRFGYDAGCSGPALANVDVAANAMVTLDLEALVGRGKIFSIWLQADRPVLCERTVNVLAYPAVGGLAYGRPHVASLRGIVGAHRCQGTATAVRDWYLAEGYTGHGFDTYVVVWHPGSDRADVSITYYTEDGRTISRTLSQPGMSRRTIAVHDQDDPAALGRNRIFGMRVEASAPVVVERIVYLTQAGTDAPVRGVAAAVGQPTPRLRWTMPSSVPSPAASDYLAVLNPASHAAHVVVRYQVTDEDVVERELVVGPASRTTVVIHEAASPSNPAGLGSRVSHGIDLVATQPVVVERMAYWSTTDALGRRAEAIGRWCDQGPSIDGARVVHFSHGDGQSDDYDALVVRNAGAGSAHIRVLEVATATTTVLLDAALSPGERTCLSLPGRDRDSATGDLATGLRVEILGEASADVRCERTRLRSGPGASLVVSVSHGLAIALEPSAAGVGQNEQRDERGR